MLKMTRTPKMRTRVSSTGRLRVRLRSNACSIRHRNSISNRHIRNRFGGAR